MNACTIDTTNNDCVPLDDDNTDKSLETPPTENIFLIEQAHNIFCKTTTL